MSITWRQQLSVDNGKIDRDHKVLIDIVNRFENESNGPKIKLTLDDLRQYTMLHFETEEGLQRAVAYPFLEAHKKSHAALISELDKIIKHYKSAGNKSDMQAVRAETATLLHDWLVNHIIKEDLLMRPFAKQLRDKQL
jgi:hemerythrin